MAGEPRPRRPDHRLPEDPRSHARPREDRPRPLRAREARPDDGLLPGDGRDRPRGGPLRPAEAPAGGRRGFQEIHGRASRRSTSRNDRILGAAPRTRRAATARRSSSRPTTASSGAPDRPAFYSGVQFDTAFLWHRDSRDARGRGSRPSCRSQERGKASVFDVAPTRSAVCWVSPPTRRSRESRSRGSGGERRSPKAVAPVSWEKAAKVERLVRAARWAPKRRRRADEFTKKLISLGYLTGSEAAAVRRPSADRAGTETTGHYQNLATFLRARGKYDESVPLYRKALEVNPKSATAWMNLSIALFHVDRWDEADEALVKSIQLGYNDPEAAVVPTGLDLHAAHRAPSRRPKGPHPLPSLPRDGLPAERPLRRVTREGALRGPAVRGVAGGLLEDRLEEAGRRRGSQPHGAHVALSRKDRRRRRGGSGSRSRSTRTSPPSAKRPSSSKEEARPSDEPPPFPRTSWPRPRSWRAVPAERRRLRPQRSRPRPRAGCRAAPAEPTPSAPPAAAPKSADPRTEALLGWLGGLLPVGPRRADARRPRRREDPGLEALPRREEVHRRRAGQRPGLRPRRRHREDGPRRRRLRRRGAPEGAEADPGRIRPRLAPRAPRALPERPVQGLLRPVARPALVQGPEDPARDRLRRLRHRGLRLLRGRRAPPRRAGVGPGKQLRRAAAGA